MTHPEETEQTGDTGGRSERFRELADEVMEENEDKYRVMGRAP